VKRQCAEASEKAQKSRREGRLVQTRELLVRCGQSECPDLVRQDCTKWLAEVDESMPSVVLEVRARDGTDVVSARTEIDGVAVEGATGSAVAVDPGVHTFAAISGEQRAEVTSIVRVGEKNRPITIHLETARAPAAAPASVAPPVSAPAEEDRGDGRRVAAYISMGVTALATTSFLYFGLNGVSERSDLLETCGKDCDLSDRDSVSRKFLVADISLGIAVVAAAASVWLLLTSPSRAAHAAGRQHTALSGNR
jgi:hypothetical protein